MTEPERDHDEQPHRMKVREEWRKIKAACTRQGKASELLAPVVNEEVEKRREATEAPPLEWDEWDESSCGQYALRFIGGRGWFVAVRGAEATEWSQFFSHRSAAVEWAELHAQGVETAERLREAVK